MKHKIKKTNIIFDEKSLPKSTFLQKFCSYFTIDIADEKIESLKQLETIFVSKIRFFDEERLLDVLVNLESLEMDTSLTKKNKKFVDQTLLRLLRIYDKNKGLSGRTLAFLKAKEFLKDYDVEFISFD